MQSRIAQFLIGELLAFGAFVFGGLAILGGAVTWNGGSRHSPTLSWALIALFAGAALFLGKSAAARLRRAFARAS